MALTYKYPKKDQIPTDLTAHYVERDGAFVLDVEGVVDAASSSAALAKATEERDALVKQQARLENRRVCTPCGETERRVTASGSSGKLFRCYTTFSVMVMCRPEIGQTLSSSIHAFLTGPQLRRLRVKLSSGDAIWQVGAGSAECAK